MTGGRRRLARRVVVAAGLLAVLATWAVLLRPQQLGGSAVWIVVRGDSMLPHHHAGDLVVLHREAAYRRGDVVAYRVPAGEIGAGHLVIHRIVGGDAFTGFVVKGDNNPAPDPWRPPAADVVGSEWLTLPGAGQVLAQLRTPAMLAALAATLSLLAVLRTGTIRVRARPAAAQGGEAPG